MFKKGDLKKAKGAEVFWIEPPLVINGKAYSVYVIKDDDGKITAHVEPKEEG